MEGTQAPPHLSQSLASLVLPALARGFAPRPRPYEALSFLELDLKDLDSLRTARLKVSFNLGELVEIDQRRGSHTRAAWIRAAALGAELRAAPLPEWSTTWRESAGVASWLTQLGEHAHALNSVRLSDGEAAAALKLATEIEQVRELLAEFRASLKLAK